MINKKQKIIVIVGTTASGKTSLAVDLAWKFNGEVVSADSRQVYKYMDVGTGKDLEEYIVRKQKTENRKQIFKISCHCIDVVHPNTEFSLAKWKKKAEKAIYEIKEQGRVPIVAGGTGLYSQALVDNYDLSQGKPDKKLRTRLEKMSVEKLYEKLLKLDEKMALKLNNSDKKNKRRLIRCIEILTSIPLPVSLPHPRPLSFPSTWLGTGARRGEKKGRGRAKHESNPLEYESLVLGITWPREVLKKRILKRINDRLENENMLGEVESLHTAHKVSWKRLSSFGLEYKYLSSYLQGEISYNDMVFDLARATYRFSKRQMSWLRRWERQGRKIHWVNNRTEARQLFKKYIKK